MRKTKRGGDDRTRRSHKSRRACNSKGDATESLASFLEKVQKSKRVVDDLARRSHKSRRVRNGEEEVTESLASVWEKVRKIRWAVNDLPVRLHKSRRVHNAKEEITNSLASVHNMELLWDLDSMGYPKPPITTPDDGMILVNTFEETFGDTYPKGDWRIFSKKASSNIDRYVVALASFSGGKRYFACSGFFIEWNGSTVILTSASLVRSSSDENKIDGNLRIEVLLPKKRRIKGTLQHYSLHYNVALVSVKDCRVVRPAIIQRCRCVCSEVVAVGRCFNSGALMATIGNAVFWTGTLDCVFIERFSCKITKAGIGGPLVNLDGEVVGINFYDTRIGTPFLEWKVVECILEHVCEKSKAGEVGSESDPCGAAFWKMFGDPSNRLNSNAGEVGSDSDSCGMALWKMDGDPSDRLSSTAGEVGSGSDPCGAAFWKIDGDPSDRLNRWPVPVPCWRRRDDVDKDNKCEDDELDLEPPPPSDSYAYELGLPFEQELGSEPPSSRRSNKCRRNPYRYGYVDGEKVLLYL